MNKELPPPPIVKVWIDIQSQDTLASVKDDRLDLLVYYFGTVKAAIDYVEQHNHS
jgi:hypothetical protein